jgi:hypothetical protein
MKILYTPMVGLVHRVEVVARELGLYDAITWERAMPYDRPTHLTDQNPLSKVPTLITEGGVALFPGTLIYEYLESIAGPKLYPTSADERWPAMQLLSLGEGLWDMTKGPKPSNHRNNVPAISRLLSACWIDLKNWHPHSPGFTSAILLLPGVSAFSTFAADATLKRTNLAVSCPIFTKGALR